MLVLCTECGKLRANLLVAKERLSVFVRHNGHKHDSEVGTELRALVVAHLNALGAWEAHLEAHANVCDFAPLAARARISA
jgi:hypothetical protein